MARRLDEQFGVNVSTWGLNMGSQHGDDGTNKKGFARRRDEACIVIVQIRSSLCHGRRRFRETGRRMCGVCVCEIKGGEYYHA